MPHEQDSHPYVLVPTPTGKLRTRVAMVGHEAVLIATSETIPEVPLVRFHSSCVFGESFHALDCDCGAQLNAAIAAIARDGGVLTYAWEEGRGIGIVDKLRAIALQQTRGLSTAEAFAALGHGPDPRSFAKHIAALKQVFSGNRIKFTSNNPRKIEALTDAGYVVQRVKLDVEMTPQRKAYIQHKREHLGHLHDN
jgi:GTP cyclohydrolase II